MFRFFLEELINLKSRLLLGRRGTHGRFEQTDPLGRYEVLLTLREAILKSSAKCLTFFRSEEKRKKIVGLRKDGARLPNPNSHFTSTHLRPV